MLTVAQLKKICENNKYILLRYPDGEVHGLNCGVSSIVLKRKNYPPDQNTDYISWRACGLEEYIQNKIPFMAKPLKK